MAYNTIMIKGEAPNIEELVANAAILPGMLIEIIAGSKVQAHAKDEGFAVPFFALESELEGKGITDAYAKDEHVRCWHPDRGDLVYALLADGESVVVGDKLVSSGAARAGGPGAGYLRKFASPESMIEETGSIVAIARDAVDLSSSSGADTNTDHRIAVEVV